MPKFLPAVITRNWSKAADQFLSEVAIRKRLAEQEVQIKDLTEQKDAQIKDLTEQNKAFRKIILKLTGEEPLEISELNPKDYL